MVGRRCGLVRGCQRLEEGQLVLYWGWGTTGSSVRGSLEDRKWACALVGLPTKISGQNEKTLKGCLPAPAGSDDARGGT